MAWFTTMASPLYRVLDAGTTASGAVCDTEMSEFSAVDMILFRL